MLIARWGGLLQDYSLHASLALKINPHPSLRRHLTARADWERAPTVKFIARPSGR